MVPSRHPAGCRRTPLANSDLAASRGSRSSNSMATRFALIRNGTAEGSGIHLWHKGFRQSGRIAIIGSGGFQRVRVISSTPVRRMPAYPFSPSPEVGFQVGLQRKDKMRSPTTVSISVKSAVILVRSVPRLVRTAVPALCAIRFGGGVSPYQCLPPSWPIAARPASAPPSGA